MTGDERRMEVCPACGKRSVRVRSRRMSLRGDDGFVVHDVACLNETCPMYFFGDEMGMFGGGGWDAEAIKACLYSSLCLYAVGNDVADAETAQAVSEEIAKAMDGMSPFRCASCGGVSSEVEIRWTDGYGPMVSVSDVIEKCRKCGREIAVRAEFGPLADPYVVGLGTVSVAMALVCEFGLVDGPLDDVFERVKRHAGGNFVRLSYKFDSVIK